MSATESLLVHLVAADTSTDSLALLRTVCAQPGLAAAQLVVRVGPGASDGQPAGETARVHAPLPLGWLRAYALRRQLERRGLLGDRGPTILHAWSNAAADWALPLAATHRPLLLNVEPGPHLSRLADWSRAQTLAFVCPNETTQRNLMALGVPSVRCVRIRPCIESASTAADHRPPVRRELGLGHGHVAVAVLPPLARQTGTFIGAWATLLLEKVRPDVRFILPGRSPEAERVWRLAVSCGHQRVLRFAPHGMPLGDVLAAADFAMYLPSGDAPVSGLAWAMAVKCPVVATCVPAVTELLADGENAWLCRPNDPKDAARRMLHAIEHGGQSREHAARAHTRAAALFSPSRTVEQYRQVYGNLVSRRPAGAA
jgi:glycosyltransferase involved in cell wall biosynthesis